MTTGRGVVTPEAVLLEFDTAGAPSRAIARVVDLLIASTAASFVISFTAPLLVSSDSDDGFILVGLLYGVVALFAYPCVCETLWGTTIGKSMLGLRVVTEEGGPVRFRQAAIRSALQFADLLLVPIGVIGILSILAGRRDQRLGDRLAGTLVVRSASLTMQSKVFGFPPLPGYEAYVAGLDVAALSAERYEVLRSFLTRVGELTPDARQALANRLAAGTAAAIGAVPSPSMHPEAFLASVVAAYQQRHGGPATWMWSRATPPPMPAVLPRG